MPHYICPACKTPLFSAASPADSVGDCIDDFVARREASLARERLDLERWVDQLVEDRVGPILARREAISAARPGASSGVD
jgi:hypothetical protein